VSKQSSQTSIALKNPIESVNTIVSNGNRFMDYEIVARLKKQGQKVVLQKLSSAVFIG